jgi:hypothetical protein
MSTKQYPHGGFPPIYEIEKKPVKEKKILGNIGPDLTQILDKGSDKPYIDLSRKKTKK